MYNSPSLVTVVVYLLSLKLPGHSLDFLVTIARHAVGSKTLEESCLLGIERHIFSLSKNLNSPTSKHV